ncbi:MAG: hypothetical protein FJ368_03270 [Pelagibacterales bacterium]|nr:hypothetical protein [Pelagibacterales bacterium]
MKKIFVFLVFIFPLTSCVENSPENRMTKESYIANLLRIKSQEQKQEEFTKIQDANLDDNQNVISDNQEQQTKTEFVTGSEDVPLFQGLVQSENDDLNLGFDSGSGTISSSSYNSKFSGGEVKNFYIKTLPQMGWFLLNKSNENLVFKRENKTVTISFLNKDGQELVRFFISSEL